MVALVQFSKTSPISVQPLNPSHPSVPKTGPMKSKNATTIAMTQTTNVFVTVVTPICHNVTMNAQWNVTMMPSHALTTVHAMPTVPTDVHADGLKLIAPITSHLLNSRPLSEPKSEIQIRKLSGAKIISHHNTNHQVIAKFFGTIRSKNVLHTAPTTSTTAILDVLVMPIAWLIVKDKKSVAKITAHVVSIVWRAVHVPLISIWDSVQNWLLMMIAWTNGNHKQKHANTIVSKKEKIAFDSVKITIWLVMNSHAISTVWMTKKPAWKVRPTRTRWSSLSHHRLRTSETVRVFKVLKIQKTQNDILRLSMSRKLQKRLWSSPTRIRKWSKLLSKLGHLLPSHDTSPNYNTNYHCITSTHHNYYRTSNHQASWRSNSTTTWWDWWWHYLDSFWW